ncbi:LysE family translocator [Sphingorhabdus sp.]|uniref:LysE family translocator n=1 Tax=Sphingorhabdus sp. TaxID=1902408 RepID=UPI0032B86BF5
MLTSNFLPFLLTAILIELTPGPNMAWIALTGASVGKRAALTATAGIALGLAVVGAAAAFGLAELAQASPYLFALLRYAGAAYLLWLAWKAWRGQGDVSPEHAHNGNVRWFRHGLFLNLLNPKAALFFVAILPNYVDSAAPVMPQTLLLSATYVAVATLVHLILALLAGQAHGWFERGRNAIILRKICAILIAAVAFWFLASTAR